MNLILAFNAALNVALNVALNIAFNAAFNAALNIAFRITFNIIFNIAYFGTFYQDIHYFLNNAVWDLSLRRRDLSLEWKGCWKWCDGEERGGRRGKWWKMGKVVEEKGREGRRGK